jgi:hypothetical protein
MNMRTGKRDRFPRNVNQDSPGPVFNGESGAGGEPHAGSWVGKGICKNEIDLPNEFELPLDASLDAPEGVQGVGYIGTGL